MKKFAITVSLPLLFLVGCSSENILHKDISVAEANKKIASRPGLLIVDVREQSEYCGQAGHIPGAINSPWISGDFKKEYTKLKKNKEILLVCRSGSRSTAAAEFLSEKGYQKVYNMLGGMNQWVKAENKTEKCDE